MSIGWIYTARDEQASFYGMDEGNSLLYINFTPISTLLLSSSLQINRVWRDKRRHLLFRSWSRICLYATSLNGAKGASAAAIAVASAARAEEMEKEATTAAADSVAAAAASTPGEQALEEMPENSTLITELREKAEESQRAVRGQQEQRAMMLVRSGFSSRVHVNEVRSR